MATIQKDEYVFEVDIEKTIDYYKTHSLCECVCCENFYAQIKGKFPKLESFLADFGVDIAKPDECMSVELDNEILYIGVDYTVCGKVVSMGQYKIDIQDGIFFNLVITDGFSSPNEQTGDYFTISISNVFELPWVLDKPFPMPTQLKEVSITKDLFDIKKISSEIQSLLPDIKWEMDSGFDYISLTYPNIKNPRFPLIISINEEDGIFVDLSNCGGILECHSDVSEVVELIKDVLNDKLAVAIAYPDEEKFEKQIRYSMMSSYMLDSSEDIADFENFISRISKPRSFLNRLNVFAFHGIIEVSNWSGSRYYKFYRK